MDYKVTLSSSAYRDLESIVRYISPDSPRRAIEFGRLLVSRSKTIGQHPEMGRMVPEFGDPLIREIIVRSYRVVYRINHGQRKIEIIRFWHGKRGIPKIPSQQ